MKIVLHIDTKITDQLMEHLCARLGNVLGDWLGWSVETRKKRLRIEWE